MWSTWCCSFDEPKKISRGIEDAVTIVRQTVNTMNDNINFIAKKSISDKSYSPSKLDYKEKNSVALKTAYDELCRVENIITNEQTNLQARITNLTTEQRNSLKNIQELQKKLESSSNDKSKLLLEIEINKKTLGNLDNELKLSKNNNETLMQQLKTLDDLNKTLSNTNNENLKKLAQMEKLSITNTENEKKLAQMEINLQRKVTDFEIMKQQFDELRNNNDKILKELDQCKSIIQTLQKSTDKGDILKMQIDSLINLISENTFLESIKSKLESLNSTIYDYKSLESKLAEIELVITSSESLYKRFEELFQRVNKSIQTMRDNMRDTMRSNDHRYMDEDGFMMGHRDRNDDPYSAMRFCYDLLYKIINRLEQIKQNITTIEQFSREIENIETDYTNKQSFVTRVVNLKDTIYGEYKNLYESERYEFNRVFNNINRQAEDRKDHVDRDIQDIEEQVERIRQDVFSNFDRFKLFFSENQNLYVNAERDFNLLSANIKIYPLNQINQIFYDIEKELNSNNDLLQNIKTLITSNPILYLNERDLVASLESRLSTLTPDIIKNELNTIKTLVANKQSRINIIEKELNDFNDLRAKQITGKLFLYERLELTNFRYYSNLTHFITRSNHIVSASNIPGFSFENDIVRDYKTGTRFKNYGIHDTIYYPTGGYNVVDISVINDIQNAPFVSTDELYYFAFYQFSTEYMSSISKCTVDEIQYLSQKYKFNEIKAYNNELINSQCLPIELRKDFLTAYIDRVIGKVTNFESIYPQTSTLQNLKNNTSLQYVYNTVVNIERGIDRLINIDNSITNLPSRRDMLKNYYENYSNITINTKDKMLNINFNNRWDNSNILLEHVGFYLVNVNNILFNPLYSEYVYTPSGAAEVMNGKIYFNSPANDNIVQHVKNYVNHPDVSIENKRNTIYQYKYRFGGYDISRLGNLTFNSFVNNQQINFNINNNIPMYDDYYLFAFFDFDITPLISNCTEAEKLFFRNRNYNLPKERYVFVKNETGSDRERGTSCICKVQYGSIYNENVHKSINYRNWIDSIKNDTDASSNRNRTIEYDSFTSNRKYLTGLSARSYNLGADKYFLTTSADLDYNFSKSRRLKLVVASLIDGKTVDEFVQAYITNAVPEPITYSYYDNKNNKVDYTLNDFPSLQLYELGNNGFKKQTLLIEKVGYNNRDDDRNKYKINNIMNSPLANRQLYLFAFEHFLNNENQSLYYDIKNIQSSEPTYPNVYIRHISNTIM